MVRIREDIFVEPGMTLVVASLNLKNPFVKCGRRKLMTFSRGIFLHQMKVVVIDQNYYHTSSINDL